MRSMPSPGAGVQFTCEGRHAFLQVKSEYLLLGQSASSLGHRADWLDKRHHSRRFASEFIEPSGFVFALSGGAAILYGYASPALSNASTVALADRRCMSKVRKTRATSSASGEVTVRGCWSEASTSIQYLSDSLWNLRPPQRSVWQIGIAVVAPSISTSAV